MIGDDPMGRDCEPTTPGPIAPEALSRNAVPFSATDAHRPADLPWTQAPAGRRISFLAWTVAAIVGIVLWFIVIRLI